MKGNGKTASFVFDVISGVITIGLYGGDKCQHAKLLRQNGKLCDHLYGEWV